MPSVKRSNYIFWLHINLRELGGGQKVKLYLLVAYQFKGIGGGVKRSNYIFWLHINLRELSTEHHESKCAVITHTNNPWGGVKRYFFFFSKSGHVAYQIKVEEV